MPIPLMLLDDGVFVDGKKFCRCNFSIIWVVCMLSDFAIFYTPEHV